MSNKIIDNARLKNVASQSSLNLLIRIFSFSIINEKHFSLNVYLLYQEKGKEKAK